MALTVDLRQSTLAILAGGAGRRMGFAKSRLEINGKPILQYLLENLFWPGPTLLVTAPGQEHPPAYQLFDREVVDPLQQGPLRGTLTALEHCRTEQMIVITVDMPVLRQHHLATALDCLSKRADLLGLMFENAGQVEPFPFACRVSAIGAVAAHVESGNFAVHSLADAFGFGVEPAPLDWLPETWTNLNYPEDYQQFHQAQKFLNHP